VGQLHWQNPKAKFRAKLQKIANFFVIEIDTCVFESFKERLENSHPIMQVHCNFDAKECRLTLKIPSSKVRITFSILTNGRLVSIQSQRSVFVSEMIL
jgi:hypothetical protein